MNHVAVAVLGLLFICPGPTAAQSPAPAPPSAHAAPLTATAPRFAPSGYFGTAPGVPARTQQPRRGRYTRRGFVVGGIAGAAAGFGFGGLIALFCEGEQDSCLAAIPLLTVFGAASGAVAGAIIGTAIPRPAGTVPSTPASRPARPDPEPRGEVRRWIGSGGVSVGAGDVRLHDEVRGTDTDAGGVAFRGHVVAELGRIAIGPELGHATFGDAGEVRHAAVLLRGTPAPTARVSPYASLNLGAYQTTGPSLEFFGGGLGAGLRFTPTRNDDFVIDAEARWSRHTQNIAPMRLRTLSIGAGVRW